MSEVQLIQNTLSRLQFLKAGMQKPTVTDMMSGQPVPLLPAGLSVIDDALVVNLEAALKELLR